MSRSQFLQFVRADPLDERGWFRLTRDPNDEELDQVLELADEILDVPAIATGPEYRDTSGHAFDLHRCVDLILEALEGAEAFRSPNRAHLCSRFAKAGLLSPLVSNRRRAITVLGNWPFEPKFRALAHHAEAEFATGDPDPFVRESALALLARINAVAHEGGTRFRHHSKSYRPRAPWPHYMALQRVMRSGFPCGLAADVDFVASMIPRRTEPPDDLAMSSPEGSVKVSGEPVALVGRAYLPEPAPSLIERLTDDQKVVLSCWYSRHSDGFVRQKHLGQIVGLNEPCVVPFVLRLMGEYVWEIADAGLAEIDRVDPTLYQAFASDNSEFMATIRSRIVSYRRCYWYDVRLVDYPAYRFLDRLGLWQGSEGRRLLQRDREGDMKRWSPFDSLSSTDDDNSTASGGRKAGPARSVS